MVTECIAKVGYDWSILILAVIARRRSCFFWGYPRLLADVMSEVSLTQKAALLVRVSINEPNIVRKRISSGRSFRRVQITVVKI